MFLDRNHNWHARGILLDRFRIEWLDSVDVQDARGDTLLRKIVGRGQGDLETNSRGYNKRIVSIPHQNRLADLARQIIAAHDRIATFSEPNVNRPLDLKRLQHQPAHLIRVCRCENGHIWHSSKNRDVVNGQMRRSEGRIDNAAAARDQPNPGIMQAEIEHDLLETTPAQKGGDRVDVRNFPFHREAGGHRNDVRLAYSFHEELARIFRLELLQRVRPQIGADEDDTPIALRQLVDHVERSLAHLLLVE